MGWNIKLEDGTTVNLGLLPPSFYEETAEAEEVSYFDIYSEHPARSVKRWNAFSQGAQQHLGKALPTFDTMDAFSDFIGEAGNIENFDLSEQPVVDGFPQVPGEPEDGDTSGSPGSTDGPQT